MNKRNMKKIIGILILFCLIFVSRGFSVTIDAVSTNSGDASSFTHSHTVSGSNRLLVVAVELDNGRTVSNVSYAGQPLSLVSGLTHAGGRPRVEIWRFINPPVGTNNVVVNISGGADKVTIGAISYTGVNQTVPIDGITSVQGASTNPSVAVPSQANDLVQDAMASIAAGLPTVGSGQTQRWNLEMGGPGVSNHYGTGSTEPGASLVAMNWTISEIREWVIIGFNVKSGSVNQPPILDSIGPKNVTEGSNLTFRVHASDADGDSLILTVPNLPANAIFIDSGNGAGSFSFNPDYSQAGLIPATFRASDGVQVDSEVVDITVTNVCLAKSGDANGDNLIRLSDIVVIVNFLFKGAPAPVPYCSGDVNASGNVLLSDVVYLTNYIFKAGPAPLPYLECCL